MSIVYPWFTTVVDDSLEQGDIFFDCPVMEPVLRLPPGPNKEIVAEATIRQFHIVVLSQSCDLEQGKLETVLVCPHWPLDALDAWGDFFRSKKGKEEIRRGHVPGYHMMAACDLPGFESMIRLVSFRQVFGLPFDYVQELAHTVSPRLRLLPPYREHLAQAFARFIMRIGLPADIPPFK